MMKYIAYIVINILIFVQCVFSWDNNVTHKDISRYAAEISVLGSSGDYLKNLGFKDGLNDLLTWGNQETLFTTGRVKEWLAEGARIEDKSSRSLNHFHNPLKPWPEAGLSDLGVTGKSALFWAQNKDVNQPANDDWSWKKTRDMYHLALTSPTSAARSAFFAQTFRGLGHQMHLLQDMAVPYHVRNDAHPLNTVLGWTCTNSNCAFFEIWTAKAYPDLQPLKSAVPNPYIPTKVFFNVPDDNGITYTDLAPITQLSDANVYNQFNPSASTDTAAQTDFGLAEYTNANFFSDDTINLPGVSTSSEHSFPYPNSASTNLQDYIDSNALPSTIIAEDGVADTGFWIQKTGDGEQITHFAKPGYFTNEGYDIIARGNVYSLTFILDDACHRDYAEKLLPRAVGYSAGLLNYFFRGDIDLAPDYETGSGYVIVNYGSEDMSGTFELWYDNNTDERIKIWSGDRTLSGSGGGGQPPIFAMLAYAAGPDGDLPPGLLIAMNNQSGNITFPYPTDSKDPCKYILVFRGKMGNEQAGVVGKVVDLSTFSQECKPCNQERIAAEMTTYTFGRFIGSGTEELTFPAETYVQNFSDDASCTASDRTYVFYVKESNPDLYNPYGRYSRIDYNPAGKTDQQYFYYTGNYAALNQYDWYDAYPGEYTPARQVNGTYLTGWYYRLDVYLAAGGERLDSRVVYSTIGPTPVEFVTGTVSDCTGFKQTLTTGWAGTQTTTYYHVPERVQITYSDHESMTLHSIEPDGNGALITLVYSKARIKTQEGCWTSSGTSWNWEYTDSSGLHSGSGNYQTDPVYSNGGTWGEVLETSTRKFRCENNMVTELQ